MFLRCRFVRLRRLLVLLLFGLRCLIRLGLVLVCLCFGGVRGLLMFLHFGFRGGSFFLVLLLLLLRHLSFVLMFLRCRFVRLRRLLVLLLFGLRCLCRLLMLFHNFLVLLLLRLRGLLVFFVLLLLGLRCLRLLFMLLRNSLRGGRLLLELLRVGLIQGGEEMFGVRYNGRTTIRVGGASHPEQAPVLAQMSAGGCSGHAQEHDAENLHGGLVV